MKIQRNKCDSRGEKVCQIIVAWLNYIKILSVLRAICYLFFIIEHFHVIKIQGKINRPICIYTPSFVD